MSYKKIKPDFVKAVKELIEATQEVEVKRGFGPGGEMGGNFFWGMITWMSRWKLGSMVSK